MQNQPVSIPQQDYDEQFGTDVRFSCDGTGKQLKLGNRQEHDDDDEEEEEDIAMLILNY